jgi:hypothetical protein
VDNKLERLVISGSPSAEELEEAVMRLTSEFSELSGGGDGKAFAGVANRYYALRNVIAGFEVSMRLLMGGRFEKAVEFLNASGGVKCSVPGSEVEFGDLVKRVQLKYKNRLAKFREAEGRYRALSLKKGEKPDRRYYSRLLVMLSTSEVIKMQLNPREMTVAEFAEYLNVFNEYRNQLKMSRNGKHGNNR